MRKVPSLEELQKDYSEVSWGGTVNISTAFYNKEYMGAKTDWSSSWRSSLTDAVEHAQKDNPYWITLIYRSSDSVAKTRPWFGLRFLGYVDFQGKLHLFKYFLNLYKAVETAFKQLGLSVGEVKCQK